MELASTEVIKSLPSFSLLWEAESGWQAFYFFLYIVRTMHIWGMLQCKIFSTAVVCGLIGCRTTLSLSFYHFCLVWFLDSFLLCDDLAGDYHAAYSVKMTGNSIFRGYKLVSTPDLPFLFECRPKNYNLTNAFSCIHISQFCGMDLDSTGTDGPDVCREKRLVFAC